MPAQRPSGSRTIHMAQAVAKTETWKLNAVFVFSLLAAAALIYRIVVHEHAEGGHTIPEFIFNGSVLALCFFGMLPVPMSKVFLLVASKFGTKK